MKNNKGISLVILVITIIVMIILGGTVIISLTNNGIMDRAKQAVTATNLSSVQQLATMLWAEAYMDGADTVEEFKTAITEGLEDYDTSTYRIKVSLTGVEVSIGEYIPEEWSANVADIVDGVPIPKGFTASPYSGEKTQAAGLVIYELDADEYEIPSTESYQTSLTTRNQFVWIPVDKETFDTTFVRKNFGGSLIQYSNGTYPAVGTANMAYEVVPTSTASSYYDATTIAEVQAMYASVEEYGGFYVARYETSEVNNHQTYDVYSVMGNVPKWNSQCSTAIEYARSNLLTKDMQYGAVSTLMYGVQWDRVVSWWEETTTKDMSGNTVNIYQTSAPYSNNSGTSIAFSTFNTGAKYSADNGTSFTAVTTDKAANTNWLLTTGATEQTKVKNIYDMAGNVWEWTMEGYNSDNMRVHRGGAYSENSNVVARSAAALQAGWERTELGYRCALYIKIQ